jgi:phosphoadenosine phosphosulfate reductase
LLKELFLRDFGCADFLEGRIILLNKIAGIDRRDQVFLDGHHIATLWFDITSGSYRLDLEPAGAAFLAQGERTSKNVVVCSVTLLRGHIKGKWVGKENIQSQPEDLSEGDNVVLGSSFRAECSKAAGRLYVHQNKGCDTKGVRAQSSSSTLEDVIRQTSLTSEAGESRFRRAEELLRQNRLPVNISFSGGRTAWRRSASASSQAEADVLLSTPDWSSQRPWTTCASICFKS